MPSSDSENARDREQHRPGLERAALFGDGERMDQRGADEPRHERGVLDRIPEPPAAPAQLVVRPPAAEHDAAGEKAPRERGPRPRPARPRRVEPAAEQRRDRERERDRESDVAHVEHRRMEHHARILQQRIQVAAVGRRRKQAVERVRREQHEEQEAEADEAHDAEHARDHLVGQMAAPQRDRDRPPAEHQHPQQHRAFVRAPGRGEPVVERQLRVGVGRDVQHREVVARRTTTRGSRRRTRRTRTAPARAAARAPSTRRLPRCAPTSGSVPWSAARSSARISAKWPSSGIIGAPSCHVLQRLRGVVHRGPRRAPGRPRRRLPAACSSRRASRAPRSRGTRRRGRSCPARRRPLPSLNRSGRMPV